MSNPVLNTIFSHRSIRKFTEEPVSESDLQQIIRAAQAAPTSINGQQVSIVAIQDKKRLQDMSTYGKFQAFVKDAPLFLVFCVDYRRAQLATEMYQQSMHIQECLDASLVGAVDVGLYLAQANLAAESLGLGTVIIGGLRKCMEEISLMLELPDLVYPLVGLTIGHPAENPEVKPRLPMDAVFFREKYDGSKQKELIQQYDVEFFTYTSSRSGVTTPHTWSSRIAMFCANRRHANVPIFLKKKGFGMD